MSTTSNYSSEASTLDKLLITEYSPTLLSPLYVVGLSGASELGRIAARILLERAQARLFAELYSKHFPDHALVTEDGTCRLLRYEFYESSRSSPNMIIAYGDDGITFENPESGYNVFDELVMLGKNSGASNLILIDAIQMDSGESTYVAATKTSLTKRLVNKGATVIKDTHLLGPAGIILGMCRLHLLSAVGLFPTLTPEGSAEKSAETVVKLVEDSFDIKYPRVR